MNKVYYNEIDLYCAKWLKNLMNTGQIPVGDIDTRPIQEVSPKDLVGYTQCHFFAGISGWAVALKMAGISEDTPLWTGSPPCQPFSTAGKQKGQKDERHLAPYWLNLIRECKPELIFGEQVESALSFGWWDDVADDLEGQGYETGATILPACSIGSPHQRKRIFFLGYSNEIRDQRIKRSIMGNTKLYGFNEAKELGGTTESQDQRGLFQFERPVEPCSMGNTKHNGLFTIEECRGDEETGNNRRQEGENSTRKPSGTSSTRYVYSLQKSQSSFWDGEWLNCPDGKRRLVKCGVHLLVNGISNRAPKLRAYGNAIVPQLAANFMACSLDAINEKYSLT